MIDYQTYCRIHLLHKKGLKASQVAQELNLDPETVSKWLARSRYQRRESPKRASKLDRFKGRIVALLERHPYTAQQILQQLLKGTMACATGAAGGLRISVLGSW